ncbi:AtpZ/AtpI family protein [Methylomarinum vadi]|uniref:AtpZ/AtpI family protein n=1 Tax=Methylomarinum vadi TaxID=438855 RepID=UPI0004DF1492|nr:AtpZ/AtpI family protein [Methylomarinum vadi]
MNDHKKNLIRQIERQARRMQKARREQHNILAQTLFLGTLGLVLVLPVIGGAYLGFWLDGMAQGYSMRWTLGLILLGLVIGVINVYLLIRENE